MKALKMFWNAWKRMPFTISLVIIAAFITLFGGSKSVSFLLTMAVEGLVLDAAIMIPVRIVMSLFGVGKAKNKRIK